MAQLQEATAGGEAVTPDSSQPATDPIEAIVEEWLGEEEEEPVAETDADVEEESEELTADDIEDETEEDEPEGPAIDPPVSWNAEEKERFKALPRETQEYLSKREAERERFVQTKAQEAAQARQDAERTALQQVAEIERQAVEQLQQLSASILPQRPDHRLLQGTDEHRAHYYKQLAVYEDAVAQQQQLQRAADERGQRLEAYEQELTKREAAEFRQALQEHLPAYLDPSEGPKLQQELGSIALELGYTAEQIAEARATDILAMSKAATWKSKSDKYDALMAKKMETVRAHKGKKLPPVAKPGAAQPRAQVTRQAIDQSWERAKQTKSADAYADYLSKAGII